MKRLSGVTLHSIKIKKPELPMSQAVRYVGQELRKKAKRAGYDLSKTRGFVGMDVGINGAPIAVLRQTSPTHFYYEIIQRTGRDETGQQN